MAPFLLGLVKAGLPLLANFALTKGADFVKEKTGVDISAATLGPDDLLKLKQYEMDHEEELIRLRQDDDKLSVEVDKMYLQDVADARDMQKEALKQDDKFSKRFIYWFAIAWSLAAVCYIFGITFFDIPTKNMRFADTILGFLLGTIVGQIVAFFFGSSKSSQNKDEVIKQAMDIRGGSQ